MMVVGGRLAAVALLACAAAYQQPPLLSSRPTGLARSRHPALLSATARDDDVEALIDAANREAPRLAERLVLAASSAGDDIRAANRRSGGSAKLVSSSLTGVSSEGLELSASVSVNRNAFGLGAPTVEDVGPVAVPWTRLFGGGADDDDQAASGIADWSPATARSRLVRAACALECGAEAARLATVDPPSPNLWLNNVPASRATRSYFYELTAQALCDVLLPGGSSAPASRRQPATQRVSLFVKPPELDDELDTYRVGTLLELARSIALTVVRERGLRVRVCVQAPAGTGTFAGLPLSLNGVRRLLEAMDWGAGSDELFAEKYIRFGAVGADDVDDLDDVFLILAPQSTVGCSVVDPLREMADKAEGRTIALLNPKLKDVQSSQGVMSVRGRGDRLAFASSFEEIFRFQTVVPTGRTFFPILGAVVKPTRADPYILYRRSEAYRPQADEASSSSSEWVPVPDPRTGAPSPWPNSAAKAKAVTGGSLKETYDPVAAFAKAPDTKAILNALSAVGAPTE